jgi:glucan phosphorylase
MNTAELSDKAIGLSQSRPNPLAPKTPPVQPHGASLSSEIAASADVRWRSACRRIDDDRFDAALNSPVKLLGTIDQARLEQLLRDDGFLAHMDRVEEALHHYMASPTWFQETYGDSPPCRVAYFSAEFGIHESIPIYSGGLGVLAGDHLKAASDLGIPLAGVGLMYREGYFRQYLNVDGWQQERYPEKTTAKRKLLAFRSFQPPTSVRERDFFPLL